MSKVKYRVTNDSEKPVVFPQSIREVIPYLGAKTDVIVSLDESQLALVRRLNSLGIIVTSEDIGVLNDAINNAEHSKRIQNLEQQLNFLDNENKKLVTALGDKEGVIGNLTTENTNLKQEIDDLKKSESFENGELLKEYIGLGLGAPKEVAEKYEKMKGLAKSYKDEVAKLKKLVEEETKK